MPPDQLELEGQSLSLHYRALSSHGVRTTAEHNVAVRLPTLMEGFNLTQVELIDPLPVEFQDAAPSIVRPETALHWINVHHGRSPLARHALLILESLDTLDLAYETMAVALLQGELDGEGFPRFDAIFGGPVSYWDETVGRADRAHGRRLGRRGDARRHAANRAATPVAPARQPARRQGATELGRVERPVAVSGGQRSACPHCAFDAMDRRAFYCPKCGMRMPR